MQQTTVDGRPIRFLPVAHKDFIVVVTHPRALALLAGAIVLAGVGIVWWRRRHRRTMN